MLVFVSGASRSGKSEFAERLSMKLSQDIPRVYLATARVTDDDMRRRVERHRAARSGRGFITVERPCGMHGIVSDVPADSLVLLECLPNWLANEMFRADGSIADHAEVRREIENGIEAMLDRARHLVIVSDDIFSDGVRYDDVMTGYLRLLGGLHVSIAARADAAVECVSGLPRFAKGNFDNCMW